MKSTGTKTLKSQNFTWLTLLVAADMVAILTFVAPFIAEAASVTALGVAQMASSTVIPVVVLLFANVLPHNIKAILVYWKPPGLLPGREAFTVHGPRDSRVNMAAPAKNVGKLPSDSKEQDVRWYRLYKLVTNEPEVLDAHKCNEGRRRHGTGLWSTPVGSSPRQRNRRQPISTVVQVKRN